MFRLGHIELIIHQNAVSLLLMHWRFCSILLNFNISDKAYFKPVQQFNGTILPE